MADGITTEPLVTPVDPSTKRMPFPVGDSWGQLVQAIKPLPIKQLEVDWFSNEAITVGTSVVQLTQRLAGFTYAKITVETGAIRFTLDDSPPTASIGWPVEIGGQITLTSIEEIKDIKFIRRDGISGVLTVFYGMVK